MEAATVEDECALDISDSDDRIDRSLVPPQSYRKLKGQKLKLVLMVGVVIVVFAVAFGVGYAVARSNSKSSKSEADYRLAGEAMDAISAANIEKNLRNLTDLPHIAGRKRNKDLGYWIADLWKAAGLDSVEVKEYEVLLSYPQEKDHAALEIVKSDKSKIFVADLSEPTLTSDEAKPGVVPPFNAYAPSGKVQGDLVYVNYARVEDFETLVKWGISVKGKIAIARYGRLFRGDKVALASQAGAVGLLLYSDPSDFAPGATTVYPDSWWLPRSGVQRGTLLISDGDPLTPNYPSIKYAYRRPIDSVINDTLPQMPVLPISAANAWELMRNLTGQSVANNTDWQGGLGFPYKLGPGYGESDASVYLEVNNVLETRPIYDIIGTIVGSEEPDRYVLLGNHRDAWVFGGADPSGGTACLMEVVEGFSYLLKIGWRPRRTIKFCSWDAEEYGLLGSSEWGEENGKILGDRVIGYLNTDIAVEGRYILDMSSSPLLKHVLTEAAKRVKSPDAGYEFLYDLWTDRNEREELIGTLGSGSDYSVFFQHIGIPSSNMRFTYDYKKYKISSYPTYHSVHDTFAWIKKFVDPDFSYHRAIAQYWVQVSFALSEERVIPLNCVDYAEALQKYFSGLDKSYGNVLKTQNISLTPLSSAIRDFADTAAAFEKPSSTASDIQIRMANDQLMFLERMFIVPEGLPGRPWYRHVVFAPSSHNSYAGSTFPGISDALFPSTPDWELVRQQLSIVYLVVKEATLSISLIN